MTAVVRHVRTQVSTGAWSVGTTASGAFRPVAPPPRLVGPPRAARPTFTRWLRAMPRPRFAAFAASLSLSSAVGCFVGVAVGHLLA